VRAILYVDRNAEQFLHARKSCVGLLRGDPFVTDFRPPRQTQEAPAGFSVAPEHRGPPFDELDIVSHQRRALTGTTANDDVIAPHQQRPIGE